MNVNKSMVAAFILVLAGAGFATAQQPAQRSSTAAQKPQVIIYHTESLTPAFNALAAAFTKKTRIPVVHQGFGAVDAARRATVGKEPVDIYVTVDYNIIDAYLKPDFADYNIRFSTGAEVLAYTTTSRGASVITAANANFNPPAAVPSVIMGWFSFLAADSVRIAGSAPSLDPGGYRALMGMQLAEQLFTLPYGTLQNKYTVADSGKTLGTDYDFTFVYEHSAREAVKTNPNYRYARLPAPVAQTDPTWEQRYSRVRYQIPGVQDMRSRTIPGTRIMFGLTVLKNAPHAAEAIQFLEFILSQEGMDIQRTAGLDPIPATALQDDIQKLPASLKTLVTAQ